VKLSSISGTAKFISGILVGAFLFGGTAVAVNSYVSDNTPRGGFLLCANNKTKAVTFPNKLSCPSGTIPLDLGANNPTRELKSFTESIVATSTFASVALQQSSNRYVAVLPIRASMFKSGKDWYNVKVSMNNFSESSSRLECQVMPMNSFSGNQNDGTTVNTSTILFAGFQTTLEFSGEFVFNGGDYVLACKSNSNVLINATVKVKKSQSVEFLGL
jgi:hypothetical protein